MNERRPACRRPDVRTSTWRRRRLCSSPSTWPSSCAMTLRATFLYDSGGTPAVRIATNAGACSRAGIVNDANSPRASTMTTSVSIARTDAGRRMPAMFIAMLIRCSSSSSTSASENEIGPRSVAACCARSWPFQNATASRTYATRSSCRSPTIVTRSVAAFATVATNRDDNTASATRVMRVAASRHAPHGAHGAVIAAMRTRSSGRSSGPAARDRSMQ
jgi:hypothetical protein